jgi:hypothetical protein
MKKIILITFIIGSAHAYENSHCLSNFNAINIKHPDENFKYFKCSEKEIEFDGKKVSTIGCSAKNGDYSYPKKVNDNEFVSTIRTKDKWGKEVILRTFYNTQGQVTRIKESNGGNFDKDFFSSSITFNYIKDTCVASQYFEGSMEERRNVKYNIEACADWEEYLENVADKTKRQACIKELKGALEIHHKHFAEKAFFGESYKSLIASLSTPISILEENCRVLTEDYKLYSSVEVIKQDRNKPEISIKPDKNEVIEE